MNDREKIVKISQLLQNGFVKFQERHLKEHHSFPSQADYAQWLEVSPTSLSNWMTGKRPPKDDNIDKLATRLGIIVYEILEVPPRLPGDRFMRIIAPRWHKLSDQRKKYYAEMIENDTDEDLSKVPESSPKK